MVLKMGGHFRENVSDAALASHVMACTVATVNRETRCGKIERFVALLLRSRLV